MAEYWLFLNFEDDDVKFALKLNDSCFENVTKLLNEENSFNFPCQSPFTYLS